MDRQQLDKLAVDFQQAYGRTLFALDESRRKANQRLNQFLQKLIMDADNELSSFQEREKDNFKQVLHRLQTQLTSDVSAPHSILKVAEYLSVGEANFPNISQEIHVPFIIPYIGHGNLCLQSNESRITDSLQSIILTSLMSTASGQLNITVFNPELFNTFSCFTCLEQYAMYSSMEAFTHELERLSETIVSTDGLLKGKFKSLVELRQQSQQAVGQLELVVVCGNEWIANESMCKQVLRISENAMRAGVAFIFALNDRTYNKIGRSIAHSALLRIDDNAKYWSCPDYPQISITIPHYSQNEIDSALEKIKKDSENAAAVSIPFDSIDDTSKFWTESSSEGISITLGKAGLDTVTLRIGEEKTQLHNILITGAPGKGKSNLLEVMIHSMCNRYSPNELELYLLDFKDGLTFRSYTYSSSKSWLPHAKVLGLESARDFGVSILEHVENERQRRALVMSSSGATSVALYRNKFPDAYMPRIVVMIDEYQKLVEISDSLGIRAADLLENICRQGRACSIQLILASQTVAYGGAMLGKTDSVYSAFPVRIGLQNSLQASYETFSSGNDAAARLRMRGEAILNVNYGANDSNQKITVAYAEPHEMEALRRAWCSQPGMQNRIPVVFNKNETFRLIDAKKSIQQWRQSILQSNSSPMLPCGMQLSVNKGVLAVPMPNDAGRNIAILGSGEGNRTFPNEIPPNYAIGLLQNMVIALALQHPLGNARFTMINGLETSVAANNGIEAWQQTIKRFGFDVEMIEAKEASNYFISQAAELKEQSTEEVTHYIIGMALDRCAGMQDTIGGETFSSISGASSFQELLKNGPARGTHILAWWSNVAVYRDHIGFSGDGYIDTKILLKMDDGTAKNILGPYVQWSAINNRLLLHDATALQANHVLIPMMPCTQHDLGQFEAVIWD